MKLFTKEIDKKLFANYDPLEKGEKQWNELDVVCKIFNPYGGGYWYIISSDPNDPDYLLGIVKLYEIEVGSISRSELEGVKFGQFKLGLERDLSFTDQNAGELYEGLLKGKHYAKGGKIEQEEEGVDLFEDYKNMPPGIKKIIKKYDSAFQDGDLDKIAEALNEVEARGYTFDYYLDGTAYDLRKKGQKGKVEVMEKAEEFANGGRIVSLGTEFGAGASSDYSYSILPLSSALKVFNDGKVDVFVLYPDKKTKKIESVEELKEHSGKNKLFANFDKLYQNYEVYDKSEEGMFAQGGKTASDLKYKPGDIAYVFQYYNEESDKSIPEKYIIRGGSDMDIQKWCKVKVLNVISDEKYFERYRVEQIDGYRPDKIFTVYQSSMADSNKKRIAIGIAIGYAQGGKIQDYTKLEGYYLHVFEPGDDEPFVKTIKSVKKSDPKFDKVTYKIDAGYDGQPDSYLEYTFTEAEMKKLLTEGVKARQFGAKEPYMFYLHDMNNNFLYDKGGSTEAKEYVVVGYNKPGDVTGFVESSPTSLENAKRIIEGAKKVDVLVGGNSKIRKAIPLSDAEKMDLVGKEYFKYASGGVFAKGGRISIRGNEYKDRVTKVIDGKKYEYEMVYSKLYKTFNIRITSDAGGPMEYTWSIQHLPEEMADLIMNSMDGMVHYFATGKPMN